MNDHLPLRLEIPGSWSMPDPFAGLWGPCLSAIFRVLLWIDDLLRKPHGHSPKS